MKIYSFLSIRLYFTLHMHLHNFQLSVQLPVHFCNLLTPDSELYISIKMFFICMKNSYGQIYIQFTDDRLKAYRKKRFGKMCRDLYMPVTHHLQYRESKQLLTVQRCRRYG